MWFFAPPRACTRLPLRGARLVDVRAMGVEPTKLTAPRRGARAAVSTATLSPCTTLNTPVRQARPSRKSSAQRLVTARVALGGLETKVFPQAMAMGYIHIGTIAGKLNGVMPATTPTGWRIE
jgi:hypothetical protein